MGNFGNFGIYTCGCQSVVSWMWVLSKQYFVCVDRSWLLVCLLDRFSWFINAFVKDIENAMWKDFSSGLKKEFLTILKHATSPASNLHVLLLSAQVARFEDFKFRDQNKTFCDLSVFTRFQQLIASNWCPYLFAWLRINNLVAKFIDLINYQVCKQRRFDRKFTKL